VILDGNGNIFGGFTPVKWESSSQPPHHRPDGSGRSFLFTLKNPHNLPPRKFGLVKTDTAIICNSLHGPDFLDISVRDNSKGITYSKGSYEVPPYTDHGVLPGKQPGPNLFAGAGTFSVQEIEVFEITG
jgi:hypothetical protein